MELRFTLPDLTHLDASGAELLIAAVFEDERPPQGVAGLVDWRSAGRLSSLIRSGFFTGGLGEALLIPGRPGVPFDKIVLIGAGDPQRLDEGTFEALARRMLRTAQDLAVRQVVAELPGRPRELLAPERAADMLLENGEDNPAHDVWTLIEPAAAHPAITQRVLERRRRRPDPLGDDELL